MSLKLKIWEVYSISWVQKLLELNKEFLSCNKTQDIVKEIDMLGCKPIATPIEANHKLGDKTEEGLEDQSTYQ